jgi:hypothetical protein
MIDDKYTPMEGPWQWTGMHCAYLCRDRGWRRVSLLDEATDLEREALGLFPKRWKIDITKAQ